jgi:hypothetical protein
MGKPIQPIELVCTLGSDPLAVRIESIERIAVVPGGP